MDWLTQPLLNVSEWALSLLPDSPFLFLQSMSNTKFDVILGQLNWFIPVYTFVSILQSWTAAILIYYLYQIFLRWAKSIE